MACLHIALAASGPMYRASSVHRCRAVLAIHTTRRQRQSRRWEGYSALCWRSRTCLASKRPRQSPNGLRSCCGAALLEAHGTKLTYESLGISLHKPSCPVGDAAAISAAPWWLHPLCRIRGPWVTSNFSLHSYGIFEPVAELTAEIHVRDAIQRVCYIPPGCRLLERKNRKLRC